MLLLVLVSGHSLPRGIGGGCGIYSIVRNSRITNRSLICFVQSLLHTLLLIRKRSVIRKSNVYASLALAMLY